MLVVRVKVNTSSAETNARIGEEMAVVGYLELTMECQHIFYGYN